jgi:pimeloyl-ACP methyl ester carboxylesterase
LELVPAAPTGIAALVTVPEQGRPIICLHGFPEVADTWEPVAKRFASKGRRRDGLARQQLRELARSPIAAAVLYIHGRQDGCVGTGFSANHHRHFSGPFEEPLIDDAGHFIQLERPDEVASAAWSWLRR